MLAVNFREQEAAVLVRREVVDELGGQRDRPVPRVDVNQVAQRAFGLAQRVRLGDRAQAEELAAGLFDGRLVRVLHLELREDLVGHRPLAGAEAEEHLVEREAPSGFEVLAQAELPLLVIHQRDLAQVLEFRHDPREQRPGSTPAEAADHAAAAGPGAEISGTPWRDPAADAAGSGSNVGSVIESVVKSWSVSSGSNGG